LSASGAYGQLSHRRRRRPCPDPRRRLPCLACARRTPRQETPMMMQPVRTISLDQVAFRYGETAMLFDAAIAGGRITAVMGPSGSGKSTMLNLIAGFESPVSGRILVDGADMGGLRPSERPVSMIFQENNLFAHLSVASNVGLGRSPS